MSEKKRAFVLGSYTKSLINFRKQLIVDLQQRGYEVTAMAPDHDEDTESQLAALNVNFQLLPLARTGLNVINDFRTILFLKRLFKKEQPDVLIAYTIKPVIYANLVLPATVKSIALITGLGYLETGTLTVKKRILRKLILLLYRFSLRHLTYCVFQNPDDLSFFNQHKLTGRTTKSTITPGSGVDLSYYARAKPRTDPVRFLLVARLIRAKGINHFFDAAEKLKSRYNTAVEFQLIGMLDRDNPDAIDESRLRELSLSGVIIYLGEQRDVRKSLGECSVFVLPTFYREGVPRTILEALAMGKPVITTDSPGCRETVDQNKNGFLIPTHSSEALITAMEKFIQDRTLIAQMGAESYQLAVKRYDVHSVNRQLLDFTNV